MQKKKKLLGVEHICLHGTIFCSNIRICKIVYATKYF